MNASSYKDNIFRLLEQDGPFATGEPFFPSVVWEKT